MNAMPEAPVVGLYEQRLERARALIEQGDEFYAQAADEIIAAMSASPDLSYRSVGRTIGRDHTWVMRLVTWRREPSGGAGRTTPFATRRAEPESDPYRAWEHPVSQLRSPDLPEGIRVSRVGPRWRLLSGDHSYGVNAVMRHEADELDARGWSAQERAFVLAQVRKREDEAREYFKILKRTLRSSATRSRERTDFYEDDDEFNEDDD